MNLSSMVAFVGLPFNASYSLSKGAIRSFTEALRSELIGSPIRVTGVYPGAVRTGIMAAARGSHADRLAAFGTSRLSRLALRPPEAVARQILRAIERNKARVVIGPDARILDVSSRLLPGRSGLVGRAANRLVDGPQATG